MARSLQTGTAAGEARLAVLMVHGRGGTAAGMADLASRFAVEGAHYRSPQAPGGSWYPQRFIEPLAANQPWLDQSRATIAAEIDDLARSGFPADRLVLCGFSQGGCLAADMLLRKPGPYAGALIFTGGLIGPPGSAWPTAGSLAGVPVLLTGSETDDWVPAWRARETGVALQAAGAEVEMVIYPQRDHVVCDDEIERARALLRGVLDRIGFA